MLNFQNGLVCFSIWISPSYSGRTIYEKINTLLAKSVNSDQPAPWSSPFWVHTVCKSIPFMIQHDMGAKNAKLISFFQIICQIFLYTHAVYSDCLLYGL